MRPFINNFIEKIFISEIDKIQILNNVSITSKRSHTAKL